MIIKAIFEKVHVSVPLCPSVFKFLLGQGPTLHDLEAYDPSLAAQLREILRMDDAASLYLDFSDFYEGEKGEQPLDNTNREVRDWICHEAWSSGWKRSRFQLECLG
jgi:hypothetical protein